MSLKWLWYLVIFRNKHFYDVFVRNIDNNLTFKSSLVDWCELVNIQEIIFSSLTVLSSYTFQLWNVILFRVFLTDLPIHRCRFIMLYPSNGIDRPQKSYYRHVHNSKSFSSLFITYHILHPLQTKQNSNIFLVSL